MKKLLLSAMIAVSALPVMADLNGTGYYRVQNALTKRYAYLIDNKGSIDIPTSSVDVGAINLFSGFLRASSDPATVFYLESISGDDYNIAAQGTSLHDFLDHYIKIVKRKEYEGQQTYYAYGSVSMFSKYLGDICTDDSSEKGIASANASGECRMWYIHPLEADSSEGYFGIAPTLTAGGKYYYPLFAGFPYSPKSDGVKTYIVSKIDASNGVAVLKEVKGTVPAGSAVIVECQNPLSSDNRMEVGSAGSEADMSGNALKGVYFNSTDYKHENQTPYDKSSMRLLAERDGKLVFETADCEFLPRNQAYLYLPDASMRNIGSYTVIKEEEYDEFLSAASSHNPDGFYRMQNASSKRFASITDSKGSLGSSADLKGLSLYSDIIRVNSDPAAVLRMSKPDGTAGVYDRDLSSQGTSLSQIFGNAARIVPAASVEGMQTYNVEVCDGSSSACLGDRISIGEEMGEMSCEAELSARQWWLKPMGNAASGNYFGIAPTQTAGGKYYAPFMADFPFKTVGAGMSVYTVSRIDPDLEMIVIQPVTGVIPAGTPVIVECSGPLAADNILEVGASGDPAKISGNQLVGVYFDSSVAGHDNRTPYDAKAMRSLSSEDGKLVFKAADADYVVRNEAFITLGNDAQMCVDKYDVVTQDVYDAKIAELTASLSSGYYRLRNASTGRNLYLLDDKGALGGKVDLGAFRVYSDLLRANSDPASVFLLADGSVSGSALDRNLSSQGTSIYKMTKNYVKVLPSQDGDAFNIFSVTNGARKYFADTLAEDGSSLSAGASDENAQWMLDAVDSESGDDWFGITPTVTAGGKYYYPFMADFPVTAHSDGVRLYMVTKVDAGLKEAYFSELKGEVPAGTPVIVECSSPLASDNRLAVAAGGDPASVNGNLLKAVWFDSEFEGHVNRTTYNAEGMRVLSSDGYNLTFVKGDMTYLPRNQAYLSLEGIRLQGVDTYVVNLKVEAVDMITQTSMVDVYGIDGVLVKAGVKRSDVPQLGSGIYILRSGGASEKLIVR